MRQQRSMFQMKEEDKTPKEKLSGDRQQRSMFQMKEEDKTPKEKLSGDRQSNQKRIAIYPKENSE